MTILIVVDNTDRWPLEMPGVTLASADAYLTDRSFSELRGAVVFNLCRSYSYQRSGYYVSLLAEARGHRPKPSVRAIQDLRSRTIVRIVSEDISELIHQALAPIRSAEFELSIYFGQPLAKRYRRLASALFDQFQAPLLRARFVHSSGEWELQYVGPIPASEIPESHRSFVVQAAQTYFAGRRSRSSTARPARSRPPRGARSGRSSAPRRSLASRPRW